MSIFNSLFGGFLGDTIAQTQAQQAAQYQLQAARQAAEAERQAYERETRHGNVIDAEFTVVGPDEQKALTGPETVANEAMFSVAHRAKKP